MSQHVPPSSRAVIPRPRTQALRVHRRRRTKEHSTLQLLRRLPAVVEQVRATLPLEHHTALQPLLDVLPRTPETIHAISSLPFTRIITDFRLIYSDHPLQAPRHLLHLPLPDDLDDDDKRLIANVCAGPLTRFTFFYGNIFPRETKAVCRIAIDTAITETIAVLTRLADHWIIAQSQSANPDELHDALRLLSSRTPTNTVRVECLAEVDVKFRPASCAVLYMGRADYIVALRDALTQEVTSLVLLVQVKREADFSAARAQVLGYVACVYSGRKERGARKDCTTYGVATDGYRWQVVMVDHGGVVKETRLLDVKVDGWQAVLEMLLTVIKRGLKLHTPLNLRQKDMSQAAMADHDTPVLHSTVDYTSQASSSPDERPALNL